MANRVRGFRLADSTMVKIDRMRRVLGAPNYNQVLEQIVTEAYNRMRESEEYGAALRALEAADAVTNKLQKNRK